MIKRNLTFINNVYIVMRVSLSQSTTLEKTIQVKIMKLAMLHIIRLQFCRLPFLIRKINSPAHLLFNFPQ
jgi:hypothetical protein